MTAPTWIDGLRLLTLIGLSYCAWQGWRKRPLSFRCEGKKYYQLRDGRFCNAWCKIVTSPARIAALEIVVENELGHRGRIQRSE